MRWTFWAVIFGIGVTIIIIGSITAPPKPLCPSYARAEYHRGWYCVVTPLKQPLGGY